MAGIEADDVARYFREYAASAKYRFFRGCEGVAEDLRWTKPSGAVEWHAWWTGSPATVCGLSFPHVVVKPEPQGPVCEACASLLDDARLEIDDLIERSKEDA